MEAEVRVSAEPQEAGEASDVQEPASVVDGQQRAEAQAAQEPVQASEPQERLRSRAQGGVWGGRCDVAWHSGIQDL